MPSQITLEDVHKIYQVDDVKVPAINGISLEINKGDFVVLIGPSGSGKSTAMNLIGCLDTPTKGDVFLDKYNISKLSESDLAQIRGKRIGFIFQTFNLIGSLTALENVMLPMTFQNIPREAKVKKARELLQLVGLGDRMQHLPGELSGGQKQRVAIARALVNDPEIILADEPTGNLDTKTGDEIINLLVEFNEKGKTIILVTHNSELLKLGDKVVMLRDGKIVEDKKLLRKASAKEK